MSERLEFRILGPFEVAREGRTLDLPAGKPRALLALLLLRRGDVVPVDTLVDELWGESPPQTAAKNVQGYVARLRRTLGDGALTTRAPGYALQLEDGALDAARFQSLVEQARHEEPAAAADRLREALGLWHGLPLADFAYESFAQDEIRRLEDLRLAALEDRIAADLALGRHEDVLPELESLVAAHPLRERLQGQLLVALYRCGRQAEALEAYRAARRRFVDELGVEPGPELQALERKILEHDPSLQAPARSRAPTKKPLGRRRLIAGAALAVAAVVAALPAALLPSGSKALSATPNSIGVLDGDHVRAVITAAASREGSPTARTRSGSPTRPTTVCCGSTPSGARSTGFLSGTIPPASRSAAGRCGWSTSSTAASPRSTHGRSARSARCRSGTARARSRSATARSGSRTPPTTRSRGSIRSEPRSWRPFRWPESPAASRPVARACGWRARRRVSSCW